MGRKVVIALMSVIMEFDGHHQPGLFTSLLLHHKNNQL